MKREIEVYDDPKAFLAAQRQRSAKPRQKPQDARSELPRAASGHGDHLAALMRLSALGWHFYTCHAKQHWFSRADGTLGPVADSYEAAIAATEALAKDGER